MTFVEPTRHNVRIVVSREQAMKAMTYARSHDVERGGVYDARSAAINIWSKPWITPELRREFNLAGDLKGVLVTHVDDGSPAAEKRLVPGDVILEVTQEPVASPEDMQKRIEALRKDGRPSALLLVANPQGELRFVALPLKSGG